MYILYRDRKEAGRLLAKELRDLSKAPTLVLAIPRGGVVVGYEVARELGAELDIVVPRKLGAPGNPELAIGAVMHDGSVVLNQDITGMLGVTKDYLEEEKTAQMEEAQRRLRVYRGNRPIPQPQNKTVVIIDDGVATGATMVAALNWARKQGAKQVLAATPVCSTEALARLSEAADRVVCPHTPEPFFAIGQFYQEFEPVEDEEVRSLLEKAWGSKS